MKVYVVKVCEDGDFTVWNVWHSKDGAIDDALCLLNRFADSTPFRNSYIDQGVPRPDTYREVEVWEGVLWDGESKTKVSPELSVVECELK